MAKVYAEEIIYKRLSSATAVTNIVGTRIAPEQGQVRDDPNREYPLITYRRVSGLHHEHMGGASGLEAITVQLNGYSTDYSTMRDLSEQCRLQLHGFRGSVTVGANTAQVQGIHFEEERELFAIPKGGKNRGMYHFSQDYTVTQSEAIPSF